MAHDDDWLDQIALAENKFHSQGYADGLNVGTVGGFKDGYSLGVDQGNKIGSEIGFYIGFISTTRKILTRQKENESKLKYLDVVLDMLNEFDLENVHAPTYMEDVERIRGKFKQVCASLGVNPQFGGRHGDKSF